MKGKQDSDLGRWMGRVFLSLSQAGPEKYKASASSSVWRPYDEGEKAERWTLVRWRGGRREGVTEGKVSGRHRTGLPGVVRKERGRMCGRELTQRVRDHLSLKHPGWTRLAPGISVINGSLH